MLQLILIPLVVGQPASYQQITWGGRNPSKPLVVDYKVGDISSSFRSPTFSVPLLRRNSYSIPFGPVQPSRQGYSNPPFLSRSGSIVWQSRQLAEYVKLTLRQFAKDPLAAPYIKRIIDASACISSLEEAISSIDASIRLLEDAEPQLLRLVDTVKAMQEYTDVETLVRVSADIIRQLGILMPKLAPENPEICGDSPSVSFSVIQLVADVIGDIAKDQKIAITASGRQELETSSKVVEGVLDFIKQLGENFNGFNKESCVADKATNESALKSIGTMLVSLADMFESFGGLNEAQSVRERGAYLGKIVAAIEKSDLLDVGTLDCNRPGDTSLAAETLDDIADIIAEVGLENLTRQLGVEDLI